MGVPVAIEARYEMSLMSVSIEATLINHINTLGLMRPGPAPWWRDEGQQEESHTIESHNKLLWNSMDGAQTCSSIGTPAIKLIDVYDQTGPPVTPLPCKTP